MMSEVQTQCPNCGSWIETQPLRFQPGILTKEYWKNLLIGWWG